MNVLKIITILLSNKYEILIKLFELTPELLAVSTKFIDAI